MSYLELKDIKKKYNDFNLDISLSVDKGELMCIIGPSGSGKSTLIGIIAGIEQPDSGTIILSGNDITSLPIQKRSIAVVFQDYTLYSNMNVASNIKYAMHKKDRKERNEMTARLLELVELSGYEKRNVTTLSGGEAQRVQLARAIAAEPDILLLDEPLSALDEPLRKHLRSVIRNIHEELGITMIYITHDREEAFAISDRIVIMNNGRKETEGTAEQLYKNPQTIFSAFFTGDGTIIPANYVYQSTPGSVFFRPENVTLSEVGVNPELYPNHFILNGVTVMSAEYTGSRYMLGLEYLGNPILASSPIKPRRKDVSIMILKENLKLLAETKT